MWPCRCYVGSDLVFLSSWQGNGSSCCFPITDLDLVTTSTSPPQLSWARLADQRRVLPENESVQVPIGSRQPWIQLNISAFLWPWIFLGNINKNNFTLSQTSCCQCHGALVLHLSFFHFLKDVFIYLRERMWEEKQRERDSRQTPGCVQSLTWSLIPGP